MLSDKPQHGLSEIPAETKLMKITFTLLLIGLMALVVSAQQPDSSAKLSELERKLDQTMRQLEQLNDAVLAMRAEIVRIKGAEAKEEANPVIAPLELKAAPVEAAQSEFVNRLIAPEMGASEREETLRARPEIFIQSRYAALPIRNASGEFEPNFSMTRIETRWAGKVSERIGAGLEIQFHPALHGSAEELVNDAFVEYYLNDHTTARVGQFVKPFGFDIQQSSAERESPERGIFAGYFFPGQRDRGVLLSGDLNYTPIKNVQYFAGAFNGNRFFADNNRQANYVLRLRKLFDGPKLAIGVSAQHGKQILPPGVTGNNNENLIGLDFQYARGRFGLRGEWMAGNTPSTLLGIKPEFTDAFRPGAKSAGGALFATWRLTNKDHVYARYDKFNRDPVKGYNVRAVNFGYVRYLGEMTRIGIDYQFKNRLSFNDDAINGRFHINWSIEF